MAVKASIVCSFGEGTSSSDIKLELDGTLNLDSEGKEKSQFVPGEPAYILAQYDHNKIQVDRVASTDGGIEYRGAVTRSRSDKLLFVDIGKVNRPTLSYLVTGGIGYTWYGRVGLNPAHDSEGRVEVSANVPSYCEATYSSSFELYRLNTPVVSLGENETYEVVVVFYISRRT